MRQILTVAVAALVVSACAEAGGNAPAATVRDSAGITIVENTFPDSVDAPWWTLDVTPLLDIGGEDADEAYALYQVGDALRLSDGRIVVTNRSSSDVRYFSADGRHLRTTGRRGDGPGEFQQPQHLLPIGGDSVLVIEAFGSRATVIDPAGEFVRDFRLGGSGPGVGVVGRLDDGSFVATRTALGAGEITNGYQRPLIAFVALDPTGAVRDTIVSVPGAERVVNVQGGPGVDQITSISVVAPPFVKNTLYAAAGDEIAIATQDAPDVLVYGDDGALRRIVRTGRPMAPVTEQHLEAWHRRNLENMPAELRSQAPERRDIPHTGAVVPPFAAIEIDDAGHLWLADFDDRLRTPGAWSIHDRDGRLLARIRMPARFRPFHIGQDFVLGVDRDDLDIEHVRMYRLTADT